MISVTHDDDVFVAMFLFLHVNGVTEAERYSNWLHYHLNLCCSRYIGICYYNCSNGTQGIFCSVLGRHDHGRGYQEANGTGPSFFHLLFSPKGFIYLYVCAHSYQKPSYALHYICLHYNDVIMSAMASQITSTTVLYSTVYSSAHQRKHESSAS